jgi:hypothetical protein
VEFTTTIVTGGGDTIVTHGGDCIPNAALTTPHVHLFLFDNSYITVSFSAISFIKAVIYGKNDAWAVVPIVAISLEYISTLLCSDSITCERARMLDS